MLFALFSGFYYWFEKLENEEDRKRYLLMLLELTSIFNAFLGCKACLEDIDYPDAYAGWNAVARMVHIFQV